uniref:Uncharacterized protein n=1 Tax=Noccaea caerulescens TaxID=107243 RepID=A0A1J3E302_NOCCA
MQVIKQLKSYRGGETCLSQNLSCIWKTNSIVLSFPSLFRSQSSLATFRTALHTKSLTIKTFPSLEHISVFLVFTCSLATGTVNCSFGSTSLAIFEYRTKREISGFCCRNLNGTASFRNNLSFAL